MEYNAVDVRREQRKYAFNANTIGDFPYGERCRKTSTLDLQYVTFKGLDPLFATFYDLIVYGNVVTGFKLRVLLTSS